MPEYIKYNPVNGRIIKKWYSVDPSRVAGQNDILQVTRKVYRSLTRFKKVKNGGVVNMSLVERASLLEEEKQAEIANKLSCINRYNIPVNVLLKALVKVVNKRLPQNKITKSEMVNQIKVEMGL